jgi:hypothetical protein
MKFLFTIAILIFLTGCSTKPQKQTDIEGNSQDSVLLTSAENIDEQFDTEEFDLSDSIAGSIQSETEDLEREVKARTYYTLHASYLGYEADSDATWYFDSLLNIIFCDISWNMEGTSGSFTYYFEGDDILAGKEINSYTDYEEMIWINNRFKPAYGFARTDGADADDQISYLTRADYESKNTSVKADYQKLLARIHEYQDSLKVDGDEISIVIENVVNYGEDFTEKEEFTINKILFDELFGE